MVRNVQSTPVEFKSPKTRPVTWYRVAKERKRWRLGIFWFRKCSVGHLSQCGVLCIWIAEQKVSYFLVFFLLQGKIPTFWLRYRRNGATFHLRMLPVCLIRFSTDFKFPKPIYGSSLWHHPAPPPPPNLTWILDMMPNTKLHTIHGLNQRKADQRGGGNFRLGEIWLKWLVGAPSGKFWIHHWFRTNWIAQCEIFVGYGGP